MNFQMFKLDLEKSKELEIKLPTSAGSQKNQKNSRKTSTSASLTILCGSQQTVENSSRDGNTRPPIYLLWNLYARQEATVKTRHGKMDWFKIEKEYIKAVYCHPAYLTDMQSASCEILGWMKQKLEWRLPEVSITLDMQMTPPLWQKAKNNQRASW